MDLNRNSLLTWERIGWLQNFELSDVLAEVCFNAAMIGACVDCRTSCRAAVCKMHLANFIACLNFKVYWFPFVDDE